MVTANFVVLTDLPAPWTTNQIGTITAAVSATHSSGTFTVVGGGANISGKNDNLWFVNQPFSSNATITVRVVSEQNTGTAAKAGVMMRESTATDSRSVFMGLTPPSGAQWVRRSTTGGNSSTTTSAGPAAPYWVRLTRNGNAFTGYISTNGAAWTQVASASIGMNTSYSLGLAVCSGGSGSTNLSVFDNVTVTNGVIAATPPSTPPPPATISSLTLSPDQVSFSVTGEADSVWLLQESTDLIHWTPVQSVSLIDGTIQHNEADAAQPRRFFRFIWAP
jgi:regulation of enolase protein 1 (concanavalin A-like superfamily)